MGLPAFALSHLKEAVSSHRVERLLLAVDADMDVNRRELLTDLARKMMHLMGRQPTK